ncbi:hypothetical protein [Methanocaldococcus infernus]
MITIVYTANNKRLAQEISKILEYYKYDYTLRYIKEFSFSKDVEGYIFLSSTGIAIRKLRR